MGFSTSPNTHAAVLVLLITASLGIVARPFRRSRHGVRRGFAVQADSLHPDPTPDATADVERTASPSLQGEDGPSPSRLVVAVVSLGILAGIITITFTQSRTAYVTLLLAALTFIVLGFLRPLLARTRGSCIGSPSRASRWGRRRSSATGRTTARSSTTA